MKVFIIPFPEQFNYYYFCPRGHEIVLRGLRDNEVELVNHPDEADYIFLTYVPHHNGIKWDTTDIEQYDSTKIVIIDWVDEPDKLLYTKYHRYFKRSLVSGNMDGNICQTKHPTFTNILPMAYCAMKEFFREEVKKEIDIGCYLRPTCPNRNFTLNSTLTAINISQPCSYYLGAPSGGSRSMLGELHFDTDYLDMLAKTKLIVTCNPTSWEGDSRLWEALAAGSCVFVDKMFVNYPDKLIDGEHIVEYDVDGTEGLVNKIQYFSKSLAKAQEIAERGKNYVMLCHMPKNRMKYVLENL